MAVAGPRKRNSDVRGGDAADGALRPPPPFSSVSGALGDGPSILPSSSSPRWSVPQFLATLGGFDYVAGVLLLLSFALTLIDKFTPTTMASAAAAADLRVVEVVIIHFPHRKSNPLQ
ncbi:hypothetical protein L596_020294 [Steinernema carpocapsae]|uniref:Uncharacterized protein n=1 Tax=Steinernema carpocapsae TaxID=34508 RepID=A0A4U5MT62_STECR|nr:hypothetical protein L596_020294 [Steinernema carpocapsae]